MALTRDPDNGANIMKKKADLGLLDKKEPQTNGNELYIERVNFNSEFWESVLPKLCNFFQQQVLPEMSYPRVKYGLARCQLRFE